MLLFGGQGVHLSCRFLGWVLAWMEAYVWTAGVVGV